MYNEILAFKELKVQLGRQAKHKTSILDAESLGVRNVLNLKRVAAAKGLGLGLAKPSVSHFDLPCHQPKKARNYCDRLGLQLPACITRASAPPFSRLG